MKGPPKRLYGKKVKSSPCDASETANMKSVRYHGVPCPLKKTSILPNAPSPPIASNLLQRNGKGKRATTRPPPKYPTPDKEV